MTNPTIPENGLDVSEAEVDAALAAWWDYRRGNFGSTPKGQMRAALEAALARRQPPADNAVAWTKAERKAVAVEICLHWGETPWRVDAGGVEKWESYLPLADAVLSEVSRLRPLLVATPSYAEGRAAGLREAAALVRGNAIMDSSEGQSLKARTDGNRAGIAYADAIEALIGAA